MFHKRQCSGGHHPDGEAAARRGPWALGTARPRAGVGAAQAAWQHPGLLGSSIGAASAARGGQVEPGRGPCGAQDIASQAEAAERRRPDHAAQAAPGGTHGAPAWPWAGAGQPHAPWAGPPTSFMRVCFWKPSRRRGPARHRNMQPGQQGPRYCAQAAQAVRQLESLQRGQQMGPLRALSSPSRPPASRWTSLPPADPPGTLLLLCTALLRCFVRR